MAATPQSNTTLNELARELLMRDNVCICGHVSPDGDCLGSALALAAALRSSNKNVTCLLARDETLDETLATIPGADELVWAGSYDGPCDTFVAVDVPTRERLGDAASVLDRAAWSATIDHHAVDERMTTVAYVDPDAASTSLLVWLLTKLMGVMPDPVVATCAYTGLMTDTGRFQYQNADSMAFALASEMVMAGADPAGCARRFYQNRRLASVLLEGKAIDHLRMICDGAGALSFVSREDMEACGAVKADAEPLVDLLRSISTARVACMLRKQPEGVRCSLRAKDDTDVAEIARAFGGGGHKAAAGCTIEGKTVEEACDLLARRIESALAEEEGC